MRSVRDHFNPLPPHGGRREVRKAPRESNKFQSTPSTRRETANIYHLWRTGKISIHSLHTEGDVRHSLKLDREEAFQSTPSTRRETCATGRQGRASPCISIHSLHTEGDSGRAAEEKNIKNFNPLPPHGGRQILSGVRSADVSISIHSLHTEGDSCRRK